MSEKRHDHKLVSCECVDAMLSSALRMVEHIGIETNRRDLLERAGGLPGLRVSGNRIHVAPEIVYEVIQQDQAGEAALVARPEPTITVPDRSTLIADHHERALKPITRSDVVAGTKLIDSLTPRLVTGKTCGTPQDTILPMQPIEQYVIGYRYNRHGGSTSVPLTPQVAKYIFDMRELAEDFDRRRRHSSVWVPSPLKLEGNELDDLLDSGAQVLSFYVGSMPLMGITGPVDPVGVYTLALAETLGGAAILHRVFPEAKASIYPHPQPMDPRSGLMALGTLGSNRLELIKKEILEHLGMPPKWKDILTSACMPDVQAQADKMASLALGVAHGFTHFNIFPLCSDEAWSNVQLILDVEHVHTAWETLKPLTENQRAEDALNTLTLSVRENRILGEMEDTVLHLRENYYLSPLLRVYSSGQWNQKGRPDPLSDAEAYAQELIKKAEYAPPQDKFQKIMDIYYRACREFGAHPMKLD